MTGTDGDAHTDHVALGLPLEHASETAPQPWPRVLTAAGFTPACSVSIAISPRLLAKPRGLLAPDGTVPADVAELTRLIGVRAAITATALAVSPAG